MDYTDLFEFDAAAIAKPIICQLGIFGTNYSRQEALDLDDLSVESCSELTFFVTHITSDLEIGTILDIHLRVANDPDSNSFDESLVSFTHSTDGN